MKAQNALKSSLKGLKRKESQKKQVKVLNDSSKSLLKILELINNKIENDFDSLNKLTLDELIKYLNNFIKTVSESRKFLEIMKQSLDLDDHANFDIINLIHNDETATALASKLLEKLNKNLCTSAETAN
jgi:hypothetical protein